MKNIHTLVEDGNYSYPLQEAISIDGWQRCYLRVEVNHESLQFYFAADGTQWLPIGPVLDASWLSDDYATPVGFTGAFVGLCCQDLVGQSKAADFDFFEYRSCD